MFILFPQGRVSDVQRRQMTTPTEANVHAIADRRHLRRLPEHREGAVQRSRAARPPRARRRQFDQLGAADGPDRLLFHIGCGARRARARPVSFTVPTGNFGDIFAGFAAMRMGLPIERLRHRHQRQRHPRCARSRPAATRPATSRRRLSPSMDIQISSNFERLLFELAGRDAARVVGHMRDLSERRRICARPRTSTASSPQIFEAERTDEAATLATIKSLEAATGYLADPHTAVGVSAAPARRAPAGDADDHARDRPPGQVPRRHPPGDRPRAARARHRRPPAHASRARQRTARRRRRGRRAMSRPTDERARLR